MIRDAGCRRKSCPGRKSDWGCDAWRTPSAVCDWYDLYQATGALAMQPIQAGTPRSAALLGSRAVQPGPRKAETARRLWKSEAPQANMEMQGRRTYQWRRIAGRRGREVVIPWTGRMVGKGLEWQCRRSCGAEACKSSEAEGVGVGVVGVDVGERLGWPEERSDGDFCWRAGTGSCLWSGLTRRGWDGRRRWQMSGMVQAGEARPVDGESYNKKVLQEAKAKNRTREEKARRYKPLDSADLGIKIEAERTILMNRRATPQEVAVRSNPSRLQYVLSLQGLHQDTPCTGTAPPTAPGTLYSATTSTAPSGVPISGISSSEPWRLLTLSSSAMHGVLARVLEAPAAKALTWMH